MSSKDDNITIGRIDFGGGFYYIGEIKEGEPNGEGAYYSPGDSLSREGTFKDGELNGYGVTYVKGEKIHEGYYVNGERSGKGIMYAFGEKMYEGDFLRDKRNGKGTQWWPLDKSKYVGDYVDDKRTGKGVLYIDDKIRYEGDFVNDQFHGFGTYYDENGNVAYSGRFVNGSIPFETAPMKGNKWVSVKKDGNATSAESYSLKYTLPPHNNDLKETLEMSVRYKEKQQDKVSALWLYAKFVSKGKNMMVLGGHPAYLKDGQLTVVLDNTKKEKIVLKPTEISTEIDANGSIGVDEKVIYDLDKDTMKRICDCDNISVEIAGWQYSKWDLDGNDFLFQLRAAWNGVFNENDYQSYLQTAPNAPKLTGGQSQGCYIATAVYGSYDCPEVWTLRRFRDYSLDKTLFGRWFIKSYYATSPTLVKWFGNTKVFKSICRHPLDKLVTSLRKKGYMDTPYCDKFDL